MTDMLPETDSNNGETLFDAWDYKGRPAVRKKTGGWGSAAVVVVAEVNERMATLGIGVNLVTYLINTMHVGNAAAANVVTNFFGTSFMLCLLGGFLADSFLGRYKTIAVFAAVQAAGVAILAISTAVKDLRPPPCAAGGEDCIPASGTQLGVLYLALYMTALGTGGVKSSVSGFGSDQFDETNKTEKGRMVKFFNWFFFIINIGSLVAVTVLVYIQDNVGRHVGYGLIAGSIGLGLVLFLLGTRGYRFKKLAGSPLTQFAAVLVAARRKRKTVLPEDPLLFYDIRDVVTGEKKKNKKKKAKEPLPHTQQFRCLDHAAVATESEISSSTKSKWSLNTITDVEEVKQIVRMLPIWATTIMYWTVYAQMTTFSVAQASTMDRHISSNFEIPSGSLTVFFVVSILAVTPFYDRVIAPIARRITHNPRGLTPLQLIFVGLFLSILAMVSAATTELKRLDFAKAVAHLSPQPAYLPCTVFRLIPQFFFIGAGAAFMYIGQLDFFLRECPKGMKTMSTGLFLSTLALGFFVSTGLVTIVHKVTGRQGWLADNLNDGKLYAFYALVAVLSVINLAVYLLASKWYVYKDSRQAPVMDESMLGKNDGSGDGGGVCEEV